MLFSFVEADMGGQDGQMEVRERVAAYVDDGHTVTVRRPGILGVLRNS